MKIRSFIKLCAKIYKTKAAKVALLGVCSTMLLVSSGASFAKYYSENGFDDGASIAKLGEGSIYYDYEMNQTPAYLDSQKDGGIHVFIAQFRIEFSASEVARTFDLELRISKTPYMDYKTYEKATQTSFFNTGSSSTFPTYITKVTEGVGSSYRVQNALEIPEKVEYSEKDETDPNKIITKEADISSPDNTNREKWEEVADSGITTFETNKIYFGYVANESTDIETTTDAAGKTTIKDIDYTWKSIDYTTLKDPKDPADDILSTTNIDFITEGKISDLYDCNLGLEARTYYFSVIFFSDITNNTLITEDTKILSKLSILQRQ